VDDRTVQIQSFRVVFDLERRIHRIDRFRVPLPYGLPLRSVAYGAATLAGVLLLQQLAGTRQLLGVLPPPARFVLLPLAISYGLTRLRLDGRSAHAAAGCWLRYLAGPRDLVAFDRVDPRRQVRLADLAMAPDAAGGTWRRGAVHGPADVVVAVGTAERRRLRATELRRTGSSTTRGDRLIVGVGERLIIR
jgi:hypothetical protein